MRVDTSWIHLLKVEMLGDACGQCQRFELFNIYVLIYVLLCNFINIIINIYIQYIIYNYF